MYGGKGHTSGLKMDQSNAISPDYNSKQSKQYECMIRSTGCLARPGGPGPPFGGVVKTGFSLCASPLKARFGMCNKNKINRKLETFRSRACDLYRGPYRLQTKMHESHSGLWDVGIAESRNITRSFPNPAILKFSIEQ